VEQWQRNNFAATLSVFLLTAGFSFTIPFLPLYLEELDGLSSEDAALWAGIATGLGGVGSFISGPVWGLLGDRFGRKPMLIRGALGGSLGLLAMGLSNSTWQLVMFRFWIGVMAGAPAAAMALIAASTPTDRLSRALGTFQAFSLLGLAAGPVAGAGLIAWLDFRGTFIFTSGVMSLGAIATTVLVREDRKALKAEREERIAASSGSQRNELLALLSSRTVRPVLIVGMAVGFGVPMTQAVLPGFTKSLVAENNLNATVGLLFFVIFLASAVSSYMTGRLLEGRSVARVLTVAAIGAGLFLAPVGLAQEAWVMFPLVAGMALCQGAIQTSSINLVSSVVERSMVSAGFGLYQSIQAASAQLAPAFGGAIAATVGFRAVFPASSVVLVLAGIAASRLLRPPSPAT
jgi:MFS transporter, DHA1 family, multidrug resistance protein